MRLLLTIIASTAALATVSSPASAATRACPQSDPANGITAVRAGGVSCRTAFAVAERTNSVKCFLNGRTCTHRFRGRSWTCTRNAAFTRVTCRSGSRVVKYRLG